MPFPATLPLAVLETILASLATLFLTGAKGDTVAARDAAVHMLAAHRPENEHELRLAANIISFGFQALKALGQAAAPDMPLTRALRLQGSAVSLSRESAKAERRLMQMRTARQQGIPAPAADTQREPARSPPAQPQPAQTQPTRTPPAQTPPKIENAIALVRETGKIAQVAKAKGISWTKAYDDRQRDLRMAARAKKAEDRALAQAAASLRASAHGMPPIAQAI